MAVRSRPRSASGRGCRRAQRPGRAPRARSRLSRPRASSVCDLATCERGRGRASGSAPCSDASPDAFTRAPRRVPRRWCASIVVPAGVVVERPIVVLHWSQGDGRGQLPAHARGGRGEAEVTVLDRFGSPTVAGARRAPGHLVDAVVELHRRRRRQRAVPLGAGARAATWQVALQRAHLGRDAVAPLVGGRARRRVRAAAQRVPPRRPGRRERPRSRSTSATATRCSTSARCRTTWRPDTRSDLLFKGAVEDPAQSVYSGSIRIRPEAQKHPGVPDEPQPGADRGRGGGVDPEPRDRGQRRAVLAREHGRARSTTTSSTTSRAAGSRPTRRSGSSCWASSTTCSTVCPFARWSRRSVAA